MQYGRGISTHGIFVQSGPWSSSSEDCPSSSFSRDAPVFGAAVGNAKFSSIVMSLRQASSTKAMDNGAEASVGCRSSSGEERKVTPVPTAETRDWARRASPPLWSPSYPHPSLAPALCLRLSVIICSRRHKTHPSRMSSSNAPTFYQSLVVRWSVTHSLTALAIPTELTRMTGWRCRGDRCRLAILPNRHCEDAVAILARFHPRGRVQGCVQGYWERRRGQRAGRCDQLDS